MDLSQWQVCLQQKIRLKLVGSFLKVQTQHLMIWLQTSFLKGCNANRFRTPHNPCSTSLTIIFLDWSSICNIRLTLEVLGFNWVLRRFNNKKNIAVMSRLSLLICLSSILLLSQTKVYNTALTCGACTKTTGCAGNMCLIITGDASAQYCYGTDTCGFSGSQTAQFGLCSQDLSGQSCSSGVCMAGASSDMCFSTYGGTCPAGTKFNETCQGTKVTVSFDVGTGTPTTTTVDLGVSCPFASATGSYSNCAGDVYGSTCSCCASFNITGLSSVMGSCIPSNSPFVAIKSALRGQIIAMISSLLLFIMLAFSF